MEKETLSPHPHYTRKISFPFHNDHTIHGGLLPGKLTIMYFCERGIDISSFKDFSLGF
jgi:hypothetical protein